MKENEYISKIPNHQWQSIRNKYHIPNKGMDLEKAMEVLFEADDILKSLGIQYFLACGTTLGFYRGGGFIPWDDEIDIDIFSEVFVPKFEEVKKEFIKNDFIARATFRGETSKMSVFKHGVKVAMGAIYDNGKGYRCLLHTMVPSKFYEAPEIFIINGREFSMPGPISEYLTFYYGDWQTIIKSYNPNEYLNKDGKWRK